MACIGLWKRCVCEKPRGQNILGKTEAGSGPFINPLRGGTSWVVWDPRVAVCVGLARKEQAGGDEGEGERGRKATGRRERGTNWGGADLSQLSWSTRDE
jgi:hypothetical protein